MINPTKQDTNNIDDLISGLSNHSRTLTKFKRIYQLFKDSSTQFKLTTDTRFSLPELNISVLVIYFYHRKTDVTVHLYCEYNTVDRNFKPVVKIYSNKYGIASNTISDKNFKAKNQGKLYLENTLVNYQQLTTHFKVEQFVHYLDKQNKKKS